MPVAAAPFPGDLPDLELSLVHHYVNVNKRGMTLNLEDEAGQEVFRRLVDASDLLIEDTPPGTLEAMGLGYDALERINPGLIMLSVTPFGQVGAAPRLEGIQPEHDPRRRRGLAHAAGAGAAHVP